MLADFMKAMAKVVDGSDPQALARLKGTGFDTEFVNVYRNNSVCALSEVLEANYMSVLNIVGEAFFLSLVKRYIVEVPAMARTLVNYGENFDVLVDNTKAKHRLPYLGDIARLDRAWTLAHIAAEKEALKITDLAKLAEGETDLETVKLKIMPGVSLLALDWPVFGIWENIRKEQKITEKIELEKCKQYVLVWRFQYVVTYRVLEPAEYSFLLALENGDTLGEAMNNAIISLPPETPDHGITSLLPNAAGADLFLVL